MDKMKSIICKDWEVRALLNGTKTALCVPCKIQPKDDSYKFATLIDTTASDRRKKIGQHHWQKLEGFKEVGSSGFFKAPFYVGDKIFVKETWFGNNPTMGDYERIRKDAGDNFDYDKFIKIWNERTTYRSDHPDAPVKWNSSIHMLQWASRLTLEITGVEVKRVQDVTEYEAKALGEVVSWLDKNGKDVNHFMLPTQKQGFFRNFRAIYGDEFFESNPWVWLYSVKAVK